MYIKIQYVSLQSKTYIMPARKHSVDEVLRSLRNKRDVQVQGSTIYILKGILRNAAGEYVRNQQLTGDIGNGTNGKIDFLVNYCDYTINYVARF